METYQRTRPRPARSIVFPPTTLRNEGWFQIEGSYAAAPKWAKYD
ncbi:hypothetical protein [Aquiflexum lacus]|nr:hypothetical protein [Aquiflexum lacus]